MDLKTNKRNIIGILIITLIFGAFFLISFFRMNDGNDKKEEIVNKDYVELFKEKLDIEFNSENDFINFSSVGKELIVEPTKYKYYFKPCFDFVIEEDGIKITNSLAKEFYDLGFEIGMKITAINDESIKGKDYFQIFELIYAKNYEEKKIFTINGQTTIEYTYAAYNNRYDYDAEKNVLSIYDLDVANQEVIYDFYSKNNEMVLDLSKATLNTFDGIRNFVSLFSMGKEPIFKTPEGIKGHLGRKINQLTIVLGKNIDDGVHFALTTINKINSNIKIVENINDSNNITLSTTIFNGLNVINSSSYTIYIKNFLMETKSSSSGDILI